MFNYPFSNFQSYPMFPGGGYGYGMPAYGGSGGYGMPAYGGSGGYGMPAYGGSGGYGMPAYGGSGGYGMPFNPSTQQMPPQISSPIAEANPSASAPLNQMFQPSTPMPTGQFPARPGTIGSIFGGFRPNPVFPSMPQGRPQMHQGIRSGSQPLNFRWW